MAKEKISRKIILPVLLLLIAFSLSCAKVFFNHNQAVVLEERMAYHRNIIQPCSRTAPPAFEGTWTPTKEEIEIMEKHFNKLQRLKASECCLPRFNIDPIDQYFLQYVGILVNGKKLIYINAVQNKNIKDEDKYTPQGACDGETCCWGVLYDPEKHKFFHLAINGSA
ncbi:MAG TPA: hypothetical protein PLA03_05035 [Acidobacteriota bacterium]|nr:hypothetical protein [Acidobacteriota bacterium]